MGTPEFAVASLDLLLKNDCAIVAVITIPDKRAGRGKKVQESAVKKYALKNNLKILQPENLKDEKFIEELNQLKADLQLVVAFRMLPEIVWNMPKLGTYNLHASLLPKYRGAAPINWAIINNEKETGVTTFKLKHEIDTGNILFWESIKIQEHTTAGELHDLLMIIGSKLLLKTVMKIHENYYQKIELNFIEQNKTLISFAPKIKKENCKIDWTMHANGIHNLIRGLSPSPNAYSLIKNGNTSLQIIKIFLSEVEIFEHNKTIGLLITDQKKYLKVYCHCGIIKIVELQLEGKKRLPISDFLKGYKINEGAMFI